MHLSTADKEAIRNHAAALERVAKALDGDFVDGEKIIREVVRISEMLRIRFAERLVRVLKVPAGPGGDAGFGPRRGES